MRVSVDISRVTGDILCFTDDKLRTTAKKSSIGEKMWTTCDKLFALCDEIGDQIKKMRSAAGKRFGYVLICGKAVIKRDISGFTAAIN